MFSLFLVPRAVLDAIEMKETQGMVPVLKTFNSLSAWLKFTQIQNEEQISADPWGADTNYSVSSESIMLLLGVCSMFRVSEPCRRALHSSSSFI